MNETKPLTVTEALASFPENPQASALALGMVLMQHSRDEVNRINEIIDKRNEERIAELEKEVAFWMPLGRKWLQFQKLMAPDYYES